MRFAAIDPGLNGAIAFASLDEPEHLAGIPGVVDMPIIDTEKGKFVSALRLRQLLVEHHVDRVWIERTWAQGGPGARSSKQSAFKQGMTYGVIVGVAGGLRIPHTTVTPQVWKGHAGLIGADKDAARQVATSRWPEHASRFARKKDVDRADAALILAYAVDCEKGLVR